MSVAKKIVKTFFFLCALFSVALFAIILILSNTVSDNYRINKGQAFSLKSPIPITASPADKSGIDAAVKANGENYEVDLKIFGLIPFSTVNVEVVDDSLVSVLGQPFGMRVYTDGVLVIDTAPVTTRSGRADPAGDAGIKSGDYIVSVNGEKITCNEDLAALVERSGGKEMRIEITREGKTLVKKLKPVFSTAEDGYRAGIWVRDSSAGIGTLTFYSPAAGIVCGLGHGLADNDTGKLLELESGQMVFAEIVSVKKGKAGSPGELSGRFTNSILADIILNAENGVYGTAAADIPAVNLTRVALKNEVTDGDAQILCTVEGDVPRLYSCTVKRHSASLFGGERNIAVTVTDPDLISATGGIVQGMSGSPVLQNGKLIGAVTHVLVDDPQTGYAAYAEDMLTAVQNAAKKNALKKTG